MYKSSVDIPFVYRDDNIALLDDLSAVKNIHDSVFLEGYLVVLVLNGNAQVKMDETMYEFQPGDLFMCSPRNIIKNIMVSMDLEVRAFFVSPGFTEQVVQMTNLDFSVYLIDSKHEVIHLSQEEIDMCSMYFTMLSRKYKSAETPYKAYSVSTLLSSMIYALSDLLMSHDISITSNDYTSANQIFQHFIHILKSPDCNMHMVKDFADKLNISPKYFSSVCRKITGRSAGSLINEAVTSEAKQMLRNPQMTVKQISNKLGFANASHFGTFFRRQTGMSPQQFRKKL